MRKYPKSMTSQHRPICDVARAECMHTAHISAEPADESDDDEAGESLSEKIAVCITRHGDRGDRRGAVAAR